MTLRKLVSLALILLTLISLSACGEEACLTQTGFYFDTIVTISVYDGEREDALAQAIELCRYYDVLLDRNDPVGDIYAINHAGGAPVMVCEDTAELIALGLEYSAMSGGLFDITCGAVTSLWDFSAENPQLPSQDKLAAALATVDYTCVRLDGCTVTVPAGCMIELGGIAKGFIADKLNEMLDSFGVTKAIINLGGNIYAKGSSQDGEPWRIGVQSPFDQSEYACIAELDDCSAVTSGTYQRCFELDGTRYHHILSTQTGMPVDSDLASATIIARSSASCDALSTICMLLGYEQARTLIDSTEGVQAIFVLSDGTVIHTDGVNII